MNDGTHGLMIIKRHGGIAVAQKPEEASVDSMPLNAIKSVPVDYILPVAQIPRVLTSLARGTVLQRTSQHQDNGDNGHDPSEAGTDALHTGELRGPPSPFTCPACGGALWELRDGELVEYRCHVGHGFTEEVLLGTQKGNLEDILWSALRALEEHATLHSRIADRARSTRLTSFAAQHDQRAMDAEARANQLREIGRAHV